MPVVFIAVADHVLFKGKEDHISRHIILDKKTKEHDLEEFSFAFVELPKFKKEIHELTGVLDRWCYFLKHAEETREDEVADIVGQYPHIQRAYEAVNKFSWTREQLAAYQEEEQRIMDNIDADDTLLEQGRAEGKAEGKAEMVCDMHQDGMPPATIAKYAKLPTEEVARILSEKLDKPW
jgi:predicted transposase/invertase (TIGR01784 family)